MMRHAVLLAAAGLSIVAGPLARVPFGDPARIAAGAVDAWQKVLKLQTVASIMQTTAHPDDEQGELLALLGRGQGVRTALLTLTRGEAGDNAIGPELFDALGFDSDGRTRERRRGLTASTSSISLPPRTTGSRNGR